MDRPPDDPGADGAAAAADDSGADRDAWELLIPDDASALDADRKAYLREVGAGSALPGWMRTRRWERYGLSGPLLTSVLAVVASFAAMMILLGPRLAPPPLPTPLASPDVAAGRVGGLLPDAGLLVNGLPTNARALRPAVLLLVPADCGCADEIRDIRAQAAEFRLTAVLVGPPDRREELVQLDRTAAALSAVIAVDLSDEFTRAFRPTGLTVLGVHTDGVVGTEVTGFRVGDRLESAFAALSAPGAR